MTRIIDTNSKRRLSAKLMAGVAISAILALSAFAVPANAQWNGNGYYRNGYYGNGNGGYYGAPPVVYGSPYGGAYYGSPYYGGSPYYYAPPVVYGPGIGINLPFIGGIGIR
jgi:hypothetical protein